MPKFILALIFVGAFSKPLFAQYFTGSIYDKAVSLYLESAGKDAWQGYLIYDENCYSVAAVSVDSQTMISKVRFGVSSLNSGSAPAFGFYISGSPASDSIRLTEQEIVQFPSATVPPRTTVTLRKSGSPESDTAKLEDYKKRFAPSSSTVQLRDATHGWQFSCNLDPALIGVWETLGGGTYLSVHDYGIMMTFSQRNWDRIRGERPEYQFPLSHTVWCTGDGVLYINRLGDAAYRFGSYSIEQGKLEITMSKGQPNIVFYRK